jgi:DNA polymerase-3 subunit alpha
MAAMLTNEIGNADKLPQYITEARSMKLTVLPPDINSSGENFSVKDGKIVFGLLGIKGVGDMPAADIVRCRNEGGPFKDFIDFLDRVDLHTLNKKTIEALIKTGCFDSLGCSRALLFFNEDKAVEYAENKKIDSALGQASLFEDSGEKEFADFHFSPAEEWPPAQKLVFEKEFIGCYVSAHPLDGYREIIEKKATLRTSEAGTKIAEQEPHEQGKQNYKRQKTQYIIIGCIQGLAELNTKKGDKMARAELEDMDGKINIIFFPRAWEKCSLRVQNDEVLAILGTVQADQGDDKPLFVVDEIADMHTLKDRIPQELHIKISDYFSSEAQIMPLKNFLFDAAGNGLVYLHVEVDGKKYMIKANNSVSAPATEDFVRDLENIQAVESVWIM